MAILQSYYQDVYRSPVVRLSGYSGRHELASSILAYLDFGGATGTCKDGVAETMLAFATERGTLQPGMPVVEASSGSFGAALAVSCATTGHPCILVVPSSLPLSRRQHLQNLGARIVVCGSGGRRALEQVAKDTAARYNGYFTNYFANDDNPEYHRRVTGPQILKAAGDAIDAVVIGVGSGGTITGVAEYLKAWNSMIRIVAVEPSECAAISGGFIGHHSIAGIGPGFVPENYNPYVVDTVLTVSSADAERAAAEFHGTGRRFEIKGECNGAPVVDDYAHHPTELAATMATAKKMGYKRIIAVHQPFTYSRTKALMDDFAAVLRQADQCVLLPIMGSREVDDGSVKSEDLAAKIPGSIVVDGLESAANWVKQNAREGDLVVCMSCGDLYKACDMMVGKA